MVFHRNISKTIICLSLLLASCSGGNGGFSGLVGGDLSDVTELTITATTPSGNDLVIQIGGSQAFTVLAVAPPPASVSYSFELNGTTVSNINAYTLTGTALNVGNHIVTAKATDGISTKSKSWNIKVNGPPEITSAYSTPPKVAVGSVLNLTVTGTDPNNDPLTYDWKLNGATNAHLVGTNNTAVLTAAPSLLVGGFAGPITINVTATDDSGGTTTHNFTAEINAFNQSCNELEQYEMCTYVGIPTLGDGYNPIDPNTSSTIKMGPIALALDSRNNNLFIADWNHNLVWYWNKTANPVELLQFEGANAIPANTVKVIAGTGEAAPEAGDYSLNVGVHGPRGMYYDAATDRLYISEYNAHRVKLVASNGVTSYMLGVGSGNIDGTTVTAHTCNNPSGMAYYNGELYVACYGHHRVKAWDLTTNLVRTVYGHDNSNAGNATNFRNDRSTPLIPQNYSAGTEDGKAYAACTSNCGYRSPYGIYVDSTGLYVTHPTDNYVRYCNFSGAPRTVLGMTIGNNFCRSIIGTGSASYGADGIATTSAFRDPRAIIVDNNKILVTSVNNSDRIILINNTGAAIPGSEYGVAIPTNQFAVITATGGTYSEGNNAIAKSYNQPYDIIKDPEGTNSYIIADYNNRRVRKADYGNNFTTSLVGSGRLRADNIGDSGLANEFYMSSPSGLVYDNQASVNALFVVDSVNDRLLKVDQYGNVTTAAGGGSLLPTSVTGAQPPNSILFNANIVAYTGIAMFKDFSFILNNTVYGHLQVWNRTTSAKAYLNSTTTGANRVNQLAGDFNNYDSSTANQYDDNLTDPMLVSLYNPSGVAISENTDGTTEVFVVDQYRHCIRRVFESGSNVYGMDTVVGECKDGNSPSNTGAQGGYVSGDNESPSSHILYRPMDVITHFPTDQDITDGGGTVGDNNGKGNLIISDYNNHRIRYWNRAGTSVQFAGTTIANNSIVTIGCAAGASNTSEHIFAVGAQCSYPVAFAMNNEYLCYSQAGKHNVRCIYLTGANEGRVFTVAGSPQNNNIGVSGVPYNYSLEGLPATSQRMSSPGGLAFDPNGDLYISDQNNSLIRKVKMSP